MPSLYFQLNFQFDVFATDKEDKAELAKNGEKKIDWIVLSYQGGPGYEEADYGISIFPKDFKKDSDIGLLVKNGANAKVWVKGVAKVDVKVDLFQYLMLDKAPKFFFSHIKMDPYANLYADKKGGVAVIDCLFGKKAPSKVL